jgi:uncharacterized protein (TIGR02147 family)
VTDIYSYLDYRIFLKELLPGFTHRELGEKGGFDPGLVSKVLNGQRNLSPRMANRFATAFGLEGRPVKFFELLVLFNQARLPSERKQRLAELLAYGKERVSPITRLQHRYYERWHHVAIRELINCGLWNGENYKQLGELLQPAISAHEARQAIELLLELGMIKRDSRSRFCVTDPLISSGYEGQPVGVNTFIQQGLVLAHESIDRFPAAERNLSTLTISASEPMRQEIVRRLRKFRREILELVENDPRPERVFQMNFQVFPLSKAPPHV